MKQISEKLYEIPLGAVNAHLIQSKKELILIDAGSPGDEAKIEAALGTIGRSLRELTAIIVTHAHADHAGGLAMLQQQSDAPTYMHAEDAQLVLEGRAKRPLLPTPGLLNRLLFRFFIASAAETITPAQVDHTVGDGELLQLAGGLRVVHLPGHSAGQIALLWEAEGVLFAADAVMNLPLLGYSLGYEDVALGRQSAARLAGLAFETAVFGHGQPLVGRASQRFQRRFGQVVAVETAALS